MKYTEWLQFWLENYVRASVKTRTYERYKLIAEKHIANGVGGTEMDALSPLILQQFISRLMQNGNKRTGRGLSANSINGVISVLQNSLKTAYAAGLTADYAAGRIKRPRLVEKQVDCFTATEQKAIEYAVLNSGRDKLFGIILCLYAGLRIGELLALTWADMDLRKGLISVTKSCHDSKDGRVVEEPKTPSSRRIIPLPKQLLPLLKGLKKRSTSPFVISSNGKPVFVRSYQRTFELLLIKLHIPHKGFHSLRHTFATRAIECGMDIKTLSEILGHKNPAITLNRYAHSLIEHKKEMMNRLGKLL